MTIHFCTSTRDFTEQPCTSVGCEGTHSSLLIFPGKAVAIICLLLNTLRSSHLDLIDGDNPLEKMGEAFRSVTGMEIAS